MVERQKKLMRSSNRWSRSSKKGLIGITLVKYSDGLWYVEEAFRPLLSSQKKLKVKDTDIIVASMPKSGTTWLKALTFCIAKRKDSYGHTLDKRSPLLTTNPHVLVPSLEQSVYWENDDPDLQHIPNPRMFSTHRSFDLLHDLIRGSNCKVIYICRNPLDQFISFRHFVIENKFGKDQKPLSIEEAFEDFCEGKYSYGPIWDQILGYWRAHLENPQKVMFLRYEDLQEDIGSHVKGIAEFVGVPLTVEEEKEGVVEEITRQCSMENLRKLDVDGMSHNGRIKYSSFFRKGVVGDWVNHLSPQMAQRFSKLIETKFQGTGLVFDNQ